MKAIDVSSSGATPTRGGGEEGGGIGGWVGSVADKASACVDDALAAGDRKVALAVEGLVCRRQPPRIGSDDPLDLEDDAQQREIIRTTPLKTVQLTIPPRED